MEVQKKNYVTIARALYNGLLEDRAYVEVLEKVLSEEILKHSDKINELYEERIQFYNKLKKGENK